MKMITNVYFIRHSIRDMAIQDDRSAPLTKAGYLLAEGLTSLFKEVQITAIYSSPYNRARQTVQPTATLLNLPIITVDDLRERRTIPCQDWEAHLQRLWTDFNLSWQGEESLMAVSNRVVAAFKTILSSKSGDFIIASHGTALAVLFHALTDGQFTFEDWQKMSMPEVYVAQFEAQKLLSFKKLQIN
ncbi:histidine phosphatase family protein [Leuconostoc sp. MS02]|uniref:Histidine phosphatase family protein n=1 Tax=Leuconostoc aquikimchii TaxID=3236804 RepID=A0ABV3S2E8_9LACO